MFKKLHIPAKIGLLGLILAASVWAEDRFVVKVNGDVNEVARRHNLSVAKSLGGSGAGVHVLEAPKGADRNQVLRELAADAIRANDHVDRAQSQHVDGREALEALNSDVIEFRRRHADFALRLSSDGFNLFRAVKRAWAF